MWLAISITKPSRQFLFTYMHRSRCVNCTANFYWFGCVPRFHLLCEHCCNAYWSDCIVEDGKVTGIRVGRRGIDTGSVCCGRMVVYNIGHPLIGSSANFLDEIKHVIRSPK